MTFIYYYTISKGKTCVKLVSTSLKLA